MALNICNLIFHEGIDRKANFEGGFEYSKFCKDNGIKLRSQKDDDLYYFINLKRILIVTDMLYVYNDEIREKVRKLNLIENEILKLETPQFSNVKSRFLAESFCALGQLYFYGEYVEENRIKAFEYFLDSMAYGDCAMSYHLAGLLLWFGDSVDQDKTLALEWIRHAANLGEDAAIEFLEEEDPSYVE